MSCCSTGPNDSDHSPVFLFRIASITFRPFESTATGIVSIGPLCVVPFCLLATLSDSVFSAADTAVIGNDTPTA